MKPMRLFAAGLAAAALSAAQEPTRVFMSHCMSCHSANSGAHAPMPEAMSGIPWQDILKTLETGSMKVQGATLTAEERLAVARYLGSSGPAVVTEMSGFCGAGTKPAASKFSWNGWSPDLLNTRFQPAAAAGIDAANLKSLALKWAFGFPTGTSAFGQPTIVDGRVFTGSNDGTVYALDARTGCLYWRYQAKSLVRAAVVVGPGPRAYFGDLESNAYAVDANTGTLIWQEKLDGQPFTRITGTPKLYDGRLYVPIASQEENAGSNPQYPCCKFRGNVVALDLRTGAIVWRSYTTPEPGPTKAANGVQYFGPSGATIWSSPTIDLKRRLIYVATGNGYSDPDIKTADAVVAMDLATGKIRWSQQATPDMFNWDCGGRAHPAGNCPSDPGEDVDFGSSPVLVHAGARDLLIDGQKSGMVHAFDPDQNGKIVWQTRIGKGGKLGGILWGLAAAEGLVFAPLSDMGTPSPGGLFAVDPATGKIVWQAPAPEPPCAGQRGCSAAQLAPPTAIPGLVFSGSMDGHIRAYRISDGKIVWDFDAARDFPTVNGIKAKGGSFSATGPTVADGMMYVNSGYANTGGMAGNILLAFSVK